MRERMDNNTEKSEIKVSRGGLLRGFRNLFSPVEPPKTPTVSSSEQPKKERSHKKGGGLSRRKFLQAASVVGGAAIIANAAPSMVVNALRESDGTDNNIVDPVGPANNGEGFPPKGASKVEGNENQERREQNLVSTVIIGVPTATLTDTEKANRDKTFDTKQTNYAGVLDDLKIDGGRFTNLPFDQGSQADKYAQALAPLASAMQNAGVKPELIFAIDENNNYLAPTLTFSDTDKNFNLGSNPFRPGTAFEVLDGQVHYFQLTDRPGGEKDKIMTIPATDSLRNYVSQFYYQGQELSIPKDVKYVMAQVAPDGTVVGLVSENQPFFFVPIDNKSQATPTSNGPDNNIPPQKTEVPEEIRAKVVVETADEFDARMKETYKDLWLDKNAKVRYVDPSHFSIDGKNYKIDNPLNFSKVDVIKIVSSGNGGDQYDVSGTFLGVSGTRIIDDVRIATSDNKEWVDVKDLKVVDLEMLVKVAGKDYVFTFSVPAESIVFQTQGTTGKYVDISVVLNKMPRGSLASFVFYRGTKSQQDFIDTEYKFLGGEIPDVFKNNVDDYKRGLAMVLSATDEHRVLVQSLNSTGKLPKDYQSSTTAVDLGPFANILALR